MDFNVIVFGSVPLYRYDACSFAIQNNMWKFAMAATLQYKTSIIHETSEIPEKTRISWELSCYQTSK